VTWPRDLRLIGITPAMREGSGMVRARRVADRYFDVGTPRHALTFAAGLACEGLKPVVAIARRSFSAPTIN
jgi:1-deoxy-D-xylulose-5-phosphate synthase